MKRPPEPDTPSRLWEKACYALLAGIGVGLYASKEEAASMVTPDLIFHPKMNSKDCEAALHGWHRAVERSRDWVEVK